MAHDALGGEYTLLFNGIEVDRFAKAAPWPTDGPTIFFVGRHEPRKGLAVLLDAMRSLPADAHLWVAGDGPQTAQLKATYGHDARIEWVGRIDDDEKASRLRAADVFCAPSLRGESFGVVLLEGMAAQTPVVASDLPGYRNVARSGAERDPRAARRLDGARRRAHKGAREPIVRGTSRRLGPAAGGRVLDGQPRVALHRSVPADHVTPKSTKGPAGDRAPPSLPPLCCENAAAICCVEMLRRACLVCVCCVAVAVSTLRQSGLEHHGPQGPFSVAIRD